MPELPEIQALAERLAETFVGAGLDRVDVLQFSALKTVVPAPDTVVGTALTSVGRRGKYLLFDLDGRARVAVHLSQGGRVEIERPAKKTRPKGGVVRFAFEDRGAIAVREYGTERKAAWWVLAPDDGGPLAGLGPEPFDEAFGDLVATSEDRRRLHTFLRDQRTVAGIGRGFTDDILHRARLSPFDAPGSLTDDERERLLSAVRGVLTEGLERERARTGGLPAKLPGRFAIHGRAAEPCPRCAQTLQRVSYESYEIVYCPACQTGGRVLADRRLSRLLR